MNKIDEDVDIADIERYIANATFPIDRSNLLQFADDEGASREILNALRKIPDMMFEDVDDVRGYLREK